MHENLQGSRFEKLTFCKRPIVSRPIGAELFFAGLKPDIDSTPVVLGNPKLIEQAKERRELHSLFEEVYEKVTDVNLDIEQAIKTELIRGATVNKMYDTISDFLERDENNIRLLLYLPFELLPNLINQNQTTLRNISSARRFGNIYREAWIKLLHEVEPRANFVDGDVFEPGLPEPEVICKAGHFISEILAKGIISTTDVVNLMDIIQDPRIIKPMAEGAMVARENNLINDNDWEKIDEIVGRKLQHSKLGPNNHDEALFEKVSPERTKWLKKVEKEKKNNFMAGIISDKIQKSGIFSLDLEIDNSSIDYRNCVVLGIIKAGETLFDLDNEQATELTKSAQVIFEKFLDTDSLEIQDMLVCGLNRWVRKGVVGKDYLDDLGVKMVDLSSSFSLDIRAATEDFKLFLDAAKKIQEDPLLSKTLYPAFLVFGSRIKGYADTTSDYDTAMFFRASAKPEERNQIRSRLIQLVPEIGKIDKVLEYWLEEADGKLKFRQLPENLMIIGKEQVHFFLGGVWIAQTNEYMQIYEDILLNYLDETKDIVEGKEVRSALLGRIELDNLQYRLMHKGYRKFFPEWKRQGTKNSDLIDWKSDFWDPGYRRVATKLFLSRVFLPDLS